MFWIIFLFVLTVLFGYCAMTRNPESYCDDNIGWYMGAIIFFIGFLSVFIGITITGIDSYPQTKAFQKEVISLRSEIETIRQAQYSDIESGTLIGGSLDNQGQSSRLSIYIQEYAQKKAKYNSKLELLKIYRTMKLYRWFGYGMFIPERINELEEL